MVEITILVNKFIMRAVFIRNWKYSLCFEIYQQSVHISG